MTVRLTALFTLLYALGFALFSVSLAEPAGTEKTEAIVVLTGGKGRIERGMAMLQAGHARRMLISGVDPSVTRRDLARRLGPGSLRTLRCCVDLGSESVDTRSNAEEARRWIEARGYTSLRLVTSDWHMRRATYEFRSDLPEARIVEDAVATRPSLFTLFAEYNKYLLRRAALWLDL
ncbi:YdcF family protein [Sphingomonas sp. LHG3406-1]|uniref:YdcF family protein n=1 Tax=Sphingomonas sp. LHG3406-1 TaxID=2804617 RepID=UPI002602D916|nr:YdcF family protein [Sphingomonas sp. LHG3406-1]